MNASIEQKNRDVDGQSITSIFLTELFKRIFFTILIYIGLFCLSVSFFYFFVLLMTDSTVYFWEAKDTVLFIGVFGMVPLFGGAATLFAFPFAPMVGALSIIFIIVNILEVGKIITNHKKVFWSVFVISVILIVGTKIFDFARQNNHWKKIDRDREYYSLNYETLEPIGSDSIFIRPTGDDIVISDIYGGNEEILYSYSSEHEGIKYVSPNGKYFVLALPKSEDWRRILVSTADGAEKIDLCLVGDFYNYNGEAINSCPDYCQWDDSSSSFACKYKFYGSVGAENKGNNLSQDILFLFDIDSGEHKIITKFSYEDRDYSNIQDFAFINKDNLLFIDPTNENKFYKAENIYDCSMKITEIENLTPCDNFILEDGKIYSFVSANDYNIQIEDQDNSSIDWKKYFVIEQDIDQFSDQEYRVVDKAPIGNEPAFLFGIDNNFIFTAGYSTEILDVKSGLLREMQDIFGRERVESDKKLIFKSYDEDGFTIVPKKYRESNSVEVSSLAQECESAE